MEAAWFLGKGLRTVDECPTVSRNRIFLVLLAGDADVALGEFGDVEVDGSDGKNS